VAGTAGWPGSFGALLTAGACVCWALDNHLAALIDGITPAGSALAKGAVAGATNLSIGWFVAPVVATPEAIAAALAVGALSYGVSLALYLRSAQDLGATRSQAVFACAPFAGAALAFAFLGEPVELPQVAAALLLLPSIAALFASQHAHAHVHESMAHVHSHRHDDAHHLHEHPQGVLAGRHSHVHQHEPLAHAHPHWPDVHHRHRHLR
jgi:drug/metabolite transporter (DMT)-like permease